MSFSIQCPKCSSRLTAKNDALVGKKVPCPKCKHGFVVEKPDSRGLETSTDDDPLGLDGDPEAAAAPLGVPSDPLGATADPLRVSSPTATPTPGKVGGKSPAESKSEKGKAKTEKSGAGLNRGAVIAIVAGGGGTLLLLLVVVVVMLLSGGDDQVAGGGGGDGGSGGTTAGGSATPTSAGDGANAADAEPKKPEGPPPAPIDDKGPPPQQTRTNPTYPAPFATSAEPSLIDSELVPEPELVMDAAHFELDVAKPIDVPFLPKAWQIDETGKYLALLGERRVAILSIPDFKTIKEIGLRAASPRMSIGPKHLALLHPNETTVEIIDWPNGKSVVIGHSKDRVGFMLIRGGFMGVSDMYLVSLDDLSVPPLVAQYASPFPGGCVWRDATGWIVGGARLNDSLDKVQYLVQHAARRNISYISGRGPDKNPRGMWDSVTDWTKFRSFSAGMSRTVWRSPGMEYVVARVMRPKPEGQEFALYSYYVDPEQDFMKRISGKKRVEPSDEPLGAVHLMKMRWGAFEGTLIDGHMIMFVRVQTKIVAALHADLNQTSIAPKTKFDAVNPYVGPEVVQAPIELIPGGTSVIRVRIPEYFQLKPLPKFEHAQVSRQDDLVTIIYDNDTLLRSYLSEPRHAGALYGYFGDRRYARGINHESTPAEVIAKYRERAVPFYENYTGYKTVGTPFLVRLTHEFEVESPKFWGLGGNRAYAQVAVFWQPTEKQTEWMAWTYVKYELDRQYHAAKKAYDAKKNAYVPPKNLRIQLIGTWKEESMELEGEVNKSDGQSYAVFGADKSIFFNTPGNPRRGTWEITSDGKVNFNIPGVSLPPAEVRFPATRKLQLTFRQGSQKLEFIYNRN